MGESWMVVGGTSVMMMMKISSNPHPGRIPEQSFLFRIAVSDGGSVAELYLGKMSNPFQVIRYM
jgi:hypothetical protein